MGTADIGIMLQITLESFALSLACKGRHLSVIQERLGSLTNKCMDSGASDMEYYIQEGAHILGLQEHAHSAKVK